MFVKKVKLKKLFLPITLSLTLLLTPSSILKTSASTPTLKVHFLSTGNSDCILIEQGKNQILIDGGDRGDDKLVLSQLKKYKVDDLEYLIVTHADADHIGSLDSVVYKYKIEKLIMGTDTAKTQAYKKFMSAVKKKKLKITRPTKNGMTYKFGSAKFKLYNVEGGDTSNDSSLITYLYNGKDDFLFMGDAEFDAESELHLGKMDVLKVGHHGSKYSSSLNFLQMVKPTYAVITCGKNSYGHPTQETINRLKSVKSKILRTDKSGTITFISKGNKVKLQ